MMFMMQKWILSTENDVLRWNVKKNYMQHEMNIDDEIDLPRNACLTALECHIECIQFEIFVADRRMAKNVVIITRTSYIRIVD
jgi:hypothetical protein